MRKWIWLIPVLAGIASLWWFPDIVESWLQPRALPGDLAWEVQFNDPANGRDFPVHVAVDGDGQVLLTGGSDSKTQGSWLVKHDGSTGRELWRSGGRHPLTSVPVADAHGDIYLAGSEFKGYRPGAPSGHADTDFAVCKISGKNGTVVWKTAFDGGFRDTDWAEQLVLAADGSPVAAGFTLAESGTFGCVVKLDAQDGGILWRHQTHDVTVDLWHGSLGLVALRTGDVVFASSRKTPGYSSRISFWLTKLQGDDGLPAWTTEWPPAAPQNHILTHLAATPEGDAIAAGYRSEEWGRSLIVARLAGRDGHLIWKRELGAESQETIEPTSLVLSSEGAAFVGARSSHGGHPIPFFDRWILKLAASDGHLFWKKRDSGKPAPFVAGRGVICDTPKLFTQTGETLVCVASTWNGRNVDVQVDWLSGTNGSAIRSITFDGPAHDHDLFHDAALTQSGEVVVALASSRCPRWLKPLKALRYRLSGGRDWSSMDRESNQVDDADPYNYDSVIWKSRRSPP